MSKQSKIKILMDAYGISEEVATEYLEADAWSLSAARESYLIDAE